jgi:hypothetical protein
VNEEDPERDRARRRKGRGSLVEGGGSEETTEGAGCGSTSEGREYRTGSLISGPDSEGD